MLLPFFFNENLRISRDKCAEVIEGFILKFGPQSKVLEKMKNCAGRSMRFIGLNMPKTSPGNTVSYPAGAQMLVHICHAQSTKMQRSKLRVALLRR